MCTIGLKKKKLNSRKQRVVVNGSASDWAPVTSGVLQDSLLGINDIDIGLNNFIAKFRDDTKIGNSVFSKRDRRLQENLRKISAWSDRWKMLFNVNKCHILQVGTRNKKYEYEISGVKFECVQCVKDLGVTIVLNLKFSLYCKETAYKANRMLDFINRNFSFKNKDIILPMYISLVRPHLEYAVQFLVTSPCKRLSKIRSRPA